MIVRYIEICPGCGQWDPWRKVTSKKVKGRKRIYAVCRRCGRKETIEYRLQETTAPDSGTISRG